MLQGLSKPTGDRERARRRREGGVRLAVTTDLDVGALPLGASLAVDGVCLTVVERAAGRFAADLGPERSRARRWARSASARASPRAPAPPR